MFYMKNDDMEEMFREAASDFELNEEMAADWNSVHAALQDGEDAAMPAAAGKKRKKFFMLWWLLLLVPAALVIAYSTGYFKGEESHKIYTQNNKVVDSALAVQPEEIQVNGNNNQPANKTSEDVITNAGKSKMLAVRNNIYHKHASKTEQIKKTTFITVKDNKKGRSIVPVNNKENNFLPGDTSLTNENAVTQTANLSSENTDTNSLVAAVKNLANNAKDSTLNLNKPAPIIVQQKAVNAYVRKSYFYAGISGNADLSFIKFQTTSKAGFGMGVVTGYHFKNGISIESGLIYDKKSYYTKGHYFNTDKLPYFQTVQLLKADGNCNMWEIPLNIKYDFNTPHKLYNWYVTAGISSYLMQKEYYDFTYNKNGTVWTRGYDYSSNTKDWLSAINLGAGINIQAGKKTFLQAQPYYKVPIKGVGTGSLLLSSAGINIGVIRHIP